jgi:hypothetical protein
MPVLRSLVDEPAVLVAVARLAKGSSGAETAALAQDAAVLIARWFGAARACLIAAAEVGTRLGVAEDEVTGQ